MVSIVGNLHITLLSASRIPFAMGMRRELPEFLGETNVKFHTPHWAILFTGAVMLVLVLRRRASASASLFTVPGGVGVAVAAIVLGMWLLTNSTWREARDTAIAAGVGLAIFAAKGLGR